MSIDPSKAITPNDPNKLNQLSGMEMLLTMRTDDEAMKSITLAEIIWHSLIVKGHMIVICAQPNGGKTTIFTECAKDLAADGFDVLYVNADAGAGDMKRYHEHASAHGYTLIAPDLKIGMGPDDVVSSLKMMSSSDGDMTNTVIFLDTLKKFVDVISKPQAKQLYKIFRSLTAKGVTIIVLAHTNKYNDADGKPIYEGTGDIRSDFDELIYLIPIKNPDGSLTVSTDIDKDRADGLKNMTFIINADRTIMVKDEFINTIEIKKSRMNLAKDQPILEFIESVIKYGSKTLTEIQTLGKDHGISRRELREVLINYSSPDSSNQIFYALPNKTKGFRYGLKGDDKPF